jgi:hypothetical protein
MAASPPAPPREKGKFRLDVILLAAFTLAGMYHATRRSAHEVAGVIVIPILVLHVWLNRQWLREALSRRPRPLPGEVQFNRRWNLAQIVVSLVALLTGLTASTYVLPGLGLRKPGAHFGGGLHAISGTILIGMVGVHLGLHAHWIWLHVRGGPASDRRTRRRLVVLAALLAVFVVALIITPQLNSLRSYRSIVHRWRDDLVLVGGSMVALAAVAFGIVARARRGRGREPAPTLAGVP